MTTHRSIASRLSRGLSIVGLIGSLFLLLFIIHEYREYFLALNQPGAARQAVFELAEHVLVPIFVLIIPMAVASIVVIRRALVPLAHATLQLEQVKAHGRGALIDHRDFPTEAVPFAEAVNSLLERLDAAARNHEAFAADVAHELRTPLAVVALELDNLDHPSAERVKQDVLAMKRLVEQLMLMAQVDAQTVSQTKAEDVPLEDVGAEVVGLLAPRAIEAGKNISLVRVGEAVAVRGRRETIAAALRNLVENALRVTPAGEAVTVFAGPGPLIRVKDGGQGLSPARLDQMVQRHRRADHASSDGAGLGLSIVARIMAACGGTLETRPGSRELVLIFPAC